MKATKIYIFFFALFTLSCEQEQTEINSQIEIFPKLEIEIPFHTKGTLLTNIPIQIIGNSFSTDESFYLMNENYTQNIILIEDTLFHFPKSSFTANITLKINTDSLQIGKLYHEQLKLMSNNSKIISQNYNTCELYIKKLDLSGSFTGKYRCSESKYNNNYEVTISQSIANDTTILISNFWDFAKESETIEMQIHAYNNTLSISNYYWQDKLNKLYRLEANGSFDESYNFSVEYELFIQPEDTLFEKGNQIYYKLMD